VTERTRTANVPASVRQRLLNLAHERNEDIQTLLIRYALERLLFRLCISAHADQFVLKGAMLFQLWFELPQRPSRDADFLGFGDAQPKALAEIFRALTLMASPDSVADGLEFLPDSVRAEPIREAAGYPGVRISMTAQLAGARIPVQCDIGFGDAVTPAAIITALPVLLQLPAPTLRVYPAETVVAEKLEAMVKLAGFNSRMKDYFDLWVLFTRGSLDRKLLPTAVRATFDRRGTELPTAEPTGLGDAFELQQQTLWSAFVTRNGLTAPAFAEVVASLREECLPLLQAARDVRT
jgi:predicted nucleotidyltransferase component of viral defense system